MMVAKTGAGGGRQSGLWGTEGSEAHFRLEMTAPVDGWDVPLEEKQVPSVTQLPHQGAPPSPPAGEDGAGVALAVDVLMCRHPRGSREGGVRYRHVQECAVREHG